MTSNEIPTVRYNFALFMIYDYIEKLDIPICNSLSKSKQCCRPV